GAIRGVDCAVVSAGAARQLGRRDQLLIVERADREQPLAHALDADAEADQLERAREARLGGGGSDILLGRYIALLRQRHEVAELLVRQQAVEIGLAGNAQVKRAAAG